MKDFTLIHVEGGIPQAATPYESQGAAITAANQIKLDDPEIDELQVWYRGQRVAMWEPDYSKSVDSVAGEIGTWTFFEIEKPEIDWEAKHKEDAYQAARGVIDLVNNTCADVSTFVETVTGCHRTLQQSCMRAFMACIRQWSTFDNYDPRNEATVLLCKRIMDAVSDSDSLPGI
jgi:hypothetical protein